MTASNSPVKTEATIPAELAGPSGELPPELAGSFVQVGQKWNIEDGIRSKNDDDILNDVAEPVNMRLAVRKEADEDIEFAANLKALKAVQQEE